MQPKVDMSTCPPQRKPNMIQAIPTTYAGVTFRSRLEADYAATFDRVELPWQYEPEGFKLSDGTWYSPDFYLPSAKAWCEVKGDHNERLTKVEQFATDLWNAAGNPEYDSAEAPMVVTAHSPRTLWGYPTPNLVAIRGNGKGASVAIAVCPNCRQTTIIQLWSALCRACGYWHDDPHEAWMNSVHDNFQLKFARVPRPAGRH